MKGVKEVNNQNLFQSERVSPTRKIEPTIVDRHSIPSAGEDDSWLDYRYDRSVERSPMTGFGKEFSMHSEQLRNSATIMSDASIDVDFSVEDVPINVSKQPPRLISARGRKNRRDTESKPEIAQVDRTPEEPTSFFGDDKQVGEDGIEQMLIRRARPPRRTRR